VFGIVAGTGLSVMSAKQPLGSSRATSKFRFGVNYTPSKNWWYCWLDWDKQSIVDDLKAIAHLGMDHVRIQCLWPIFQPNINLVSESALHRLESLLDIADAVNLDVEVTVLNGWLSGYAFIPVWVEPKWTGAKRNIFTDPEMIGAEKFLLKSIAEAVGRHRRFLGFDLGNELGVLQQRDFPVATNEADVWATNMLQYCDELLPGKFHVNGVDHVHWFSNFGFSRASLANTGSATVLHAYILFTGALERYGYSGVGSLHLAEYCIELARAYQKDLTRPIWLQEFGASTEWMPANYIPEFASETIRNASTCEGLWGFTWWSSHDLNKSLKGFATLEYDLGLLNSMNHVKPAGQMIAKIVAEFRAHPPQHFTRHVALVISDHMFASKTYAPDWTVPKRFMDLVQQGVKPSIILESRIQDAVYVKQRGITEFVRT
jgi:hypothetical protein